MVKLENLINQVVWKICFFAFHHGLVRTDISATHRAHVGMGSEAFHGSLDT